MSQNPIPVYSQYLGGNKSTYNITAPAVIKATPGVLYRLIVQAAGAGGTLTVNDLAAVTGGALSNQILSLGSANLTVGQIIELAWPCLTGIAVTACSGGIIVAAATF